MYHNFNILMANIFIHTYIHTHRERERERDVANNTDRSCNLPPCLAAFVRQHGKCCCPDGDKCRPSRCPPTSHREPTSSPYHCTPLRRPLHSPLHVHCSHINNAAAVTSCAACSRASTLCPHPVQVVTLWRSTGSGSLWAVAYNLLASR